jgi:monomeric isocitrate dehydrogenase
MTSTSTISMPFKATFDMACEGVANIWEAHGLISVEAELESSDILSVRYTGESNYNGWPMLTIVFANINAAKVYTAVWMGMDISKWDVYTDEDVNDYLAHGSFVRG